jgi:hypothetical protein
MSRTWFARGLRGLIAKRIQADLFRQGFFSGPAESFVDGDFGGHTEQAIARLQAARLLPQTGSVDQPCWQQLTADPLPSLFERCLSVTADFEGHGFTLLQGNFDGAGLTWGIIGFTLSNGEIQRLLANVEAQVPGTRTRLMGPVAREWEAITAESVDDQVAWADAISSGPGHASVPAAWKAAFERLGQDSVVKRAQLQAAHEEYFVPAQRTARRVGLETELGLALCFDMHVQNGRSRSRAVAEIEAQPMHATELAQRKALAHAVANHSTRAWREDVRMRKLAVATGEGRVHGRTYRLANWGLTEAPAA